MQFLGWDNLNHLKRFGSENIKLGGEWSSPGGDKKVFIDAWWYIVLSMCSVVCENNIIEQDLSFEEGEVMKYNRSTCSCRCNRG